VNEPGNNFFSVPLSPRRRLEYQRLLPTQIANGSSAWRGWRLQEYVITKLFHFANIVLLIDAKALIDYRVEFGFLERLGQIVMSPAV